MKSSPPAIAVERFHLDAKTYQYGNQSSLKKNIFSNATRSHRFVATQAVTSIVTTQQNEVGTLNRIMEDRINKNQRTEKK